ncbi:hypothetical protein MUA77_04120 [Mammaliicoccus sciuri]|uniref:hypothetical protein n=1 Tax=Mammaliicoccus sciuri TaxID=1296 RepID=UPI0021D274D3|nr:hypothetical protein [Mammaliicoccus sciuri]UXU84620.1 hypothetical protein MUA77_04120 [Mammaliicoccus sciuri]UXU94468.1 hypothetical protein MUA42_04130 [Mammaliicoccus sciuri]UXV16416.1 hypothetical protein MUA89_04125 [Mammaliicoccus sciuri]UXV24678.1 hypothetical protein MUA49_04125 [Mammaliicoccus sciuri]UXV27462.1 hypothetical protein MUA96_04125 [Mammaliicoccus sciuri]
MPKIKVEKEMNLPELLSWSIENKEQARFRDFRSKSMRVRFNDSAKPEIIFDKRFLPIEQTFKVQIEEEITEDTKLFLISRYIGKMGSVSYLYDMTSISKRLKHLPVDCEITHFYIENENKELQLIWTKEKGLLE